MARRSILLMSVALVLAGCNSGLDTAVEEVSRPGDQTTSTTARTVPAGEAPILETPMDSHGRYRRTSDLAGHWQDEHDVPVPDGLSREDDFALTLQVSFGPDHCDWDEIVMLDVAWPLGSVVTTYSEDTVRQYARDVEGTLGDRLQSTFASDIEAPEGAIFTGYHRQGNRLLVESGAQTAVFVERPDGTVERWPRVVPAALCA